MVEVGCSNVLKVVRVVLRGGGFGGIETEPWREPNPARFEHEVGGGEKGMIIIQIFTI